MSITDHNKVIFDQDWEFIHEQNAPTEATKKLNQWRHTYEIVFILVRFVDRSMMEYLIARKKK